MRAAPSEPRDADARLHDRRHAGAGGAAALERPLPRDGHQRRRRLQPLEGPGGHALARGRDPRQLGHVLLPARRRQRRVLVGRVPADARAARTATRRSSPRRAPSSAAATTTSTRTPRSSSRPKTTSSCAASASPTASRAARTIEVTSYAEVVLAPPAADALHPAFSNLFVQTEIVARPRRRSSARAGRAPRDEQPPWMVHLMAVHGATRRRRPRTRPIALQFIGRGRTRRRSARRCDARPRCPAAQGSVLDPDRRDPPAASRSSPSEIGHDRHRHRRRRDARGRASALVDKYQRPPPRRPRVRAGLDAQPGRCCASSTPPRPTRSSTARLAGAVLYANPALRARRRRAGRRTAAGNRGCGATASPATCRSCCCGSATGEHRSGAPARAGARLLAAEGAGRRSGDLERGSRRLPSGLQEQIMGADRGRRRGAAGRPARRHLRAPRRADVGRGPRPAADGRARRSSATARGTLAEQVERRGRAETRRRRARRRRDAAPSRQRADRRRAPRARPAVLQRPRRLHAGRPRVRHHHRRASSRRRRRG